MKRLLTENLKFLPMLVVTGLTLMPRPAHAIQLHLTSEGIITHQMGHIFFLVSMVALIFTVSGKGLDKQKGWRLIQYSAFFFILWNLDAVLGHFLDNQIQVIKLEHISFSRMRMLVHEDSRVLYWVYYVLKLDHLLAVPAMFLFFLGLSAMVKEQQAMSDNKESH